MNLHRRIVPALSSLALTALVLSVGLSSGACSRSSRDDASKKPESPGVLPRLPASPTLTSVGAARKARSEARLKAEGVAINEHLPQIETEADAKIRTRDAVVDRAIALMIVAMKGEGLEQEHVIDAREMYGAAGFFTPEELAFIADPNASQQDRAKFAWRYECLAVMLWALGFDAELEQPDGIVDAARVVRIVLDRGPERFRQDAQLRSLKELLDEADLIYRYDWACVDARVNRGPKPPIDCEVVVERHHALNWLIGYQGQEWDDVSTDT